MNGQKARVQTTFHRDQNKGLKVLSFSVRLFIHPDMKLLEQFPGSIGASHWINQTQWVSIMEFWNQTGQTSDYKFRTTLALEKAEGAGNPIYLSLQGDDTYGKNNSLYNTPPAFGIYMVGKVAAWIKKQGGLEAMGKLNAAKAKLVYDAIDNSNGFYRGHADKDSRSLMNITFRLPSEELEAKFAAESRQHELCGVKGHRSVGGMRTSIYNAMPMEGCQALAAFMEKFKNENI